MDLLRPVRATNWCRRWETSSPLRVSRGSSASQLVELPHTGTIITDQPDVMWGTDATAAVTVIDGQVMVFAAIDPCTAECVGIQAAIHGDRFEDLEPLRQRVREHFGAIAPAVAAGLAVRHDHGSVYLSADFRKELAFLGMTPSPTFVRQPEGTGCIERFFRTLKERLLWVRPFGNVEELRQGLLAFKETCNQEWLIERLGFRSPAGHLRHLRSGPRPDYTQPAVHHAWAGTADTILP